MTSSIDQTKGTDSFLAYLSQYKDEVKKEGAKDYYHVDVVADAYTQGYEDGQQSAQKDFIDQIFQKHLEHFKQRSNQVYILTTRLVSFLKEKGFLASSFHIDISPECPRILVAVPDKYLLNDDFTVFVYSRINELRKVFVDLFGKNLDISVSSSNELDHAYLKEDGFGYSEILKSENEK